jgi:hypothetical protein
MSKVIVISLTAVFLSGCGLTKESNKQKPDPRVIPYELGMKIPDVKPHIDSKGRINSMYDPTVHCHTMHYPGRQPQLICRIVR